MSARDAAGGLPSIGSITRIRMLVLDVDGVLTDGRIAFWGGPTGEPLEGKSFHAHDGLALKWAGRMGIITAIVTARQSSAVERRAREMEIGHLIMGCEAKLTALEQLSALEAVPLSEFAYVGDDLPDLAPMAVVGWPVAVADAAREVRRAAAHVTERPGGAGAVREVVELILTAQGKWLEVVEAHHRKS